MNDFNYSSPRVLGCWLRFKRVPCWDRDRKRGWSLFAHLWRLNIEVESCPGNEWASKRGWFFKRREPDCLAHRFHWSWSPFFGNVWIVTR